MKVQYPEAIKLLSHDVTKSSERCAEMDFLGFVCSFFLISSHALQFGSNLFFCGITAYASQDVTSSTFLLLCSLLTFTVCPGALHQWGYSLSPMTPLRALLTALFLHKSTLRASQPLLHQSIPPCQECCIAVLLWAPTSGELVQTARHWFCPAPIIPSSDSVDGTKPLQPVGQMNLSFLHSV